MPRKTPADPLAGRIFTIRGQRVILDSDLARLYGVATKRFNEAVKRNVARFPKDFLFRLTAAEFERARSQVDAAIASSTSISEFQANWSQFATSSTATRRGLSYRPLAFTEHGAVMAANVLRSPKAVQVSVCVVRASSRSAGRSPRISRCCVDWRRLIERCSSTMRRCARCGESCGRC